MPGNINRPAGINPYSQISGMQGEWVNHETKDAEIGRRLEKGQVADPAKRQQHIASMQEQQDQDWKLKIEKMKAEDKAKSETEIASISKFIKEVASHEQERQGQMRQRVKTIEEEKLETSTKKEQREAIMGELVQPTSKPKQGFMTKLLKKGQGAMVESK